MALRRIVDAAVEPVSLAEAKDFLRVASASTDLDAKITGLITAARMAAEHELKRALIEQTWLRSYDSFPDALELSYPPLMSVTYVRYFDLTGTLHALDAASYVVDSETEPGWIVPADGYTWPETSEIVNAVSVRYVAGYGSDATAVPESIKTWIKLMVGHFLENSEASVMTTGTLAPIPFIGGLLDPFRVLAV